MFDRSGNAAREWERFGREEPYFGVLADERFRRDSVDEAALEEFFASGRAQVDEMVARAEAHLGAPPAMSRVMDFGCGVGRLLVALAERAGTVVGVDVSPSMLEEARRNCRARGQENVELVGGLDALAPGFDLITSHIVFQHIPTAAGYALLSRLAGLLAPGGVAVVQFSLRPASRLAPAFYGVMRSVPPARRLWNLARRRRADFPFMEMNSYRLERLLAVLHANGIADVSVRFAPARRWAEHDQATLTFARPPARTPRSAPA
jgi:SAM-dependent methyltransferase